MLDIDSNNIVYLDLNEVAHDLKVSVVTIRRYIKLGKLKAKKIGKAYRISRLQLQSFLEVPTKTGQTENPNKLASRPKLPSQEIVDVGHRKNRPKSFPGINSEVIETIMEMSRELVDMADLKLIISEHAKECLELVERIEKDGINDTQAAINVLLIDEAIKNLNIRRNMFMLIIQKACIVLLPLPPHLSDALLSIAYHGLVFITESDLPPHLKHAHYTNLDFIPPNELDKRTQGITAAVMEGYIEQNRIYVRRSTSNLIYQLSPNGLTDIFIHSIPHIPPHSQFVELNTRGFTINIMSV